MRHQKSGRKLGRNSAHRKAMFRNMVTSLFEHGSIRTTDAKAKELRKLADRMVTLGKRNTVHARRHAAKTVQDKFILSKLFGEIAEGFAERHGGYTRIVKIGNRRGDNAAMSIIELMPYGAPEQKQRKRPVAPKVTKRADVPQTKERFDEPAPADEAPVEAAVEEEAAEVQAADEGAVEAPAEEASGDADAAEGDEKTP